MNTIEKIQYVFGKISAINQEPAPNPGLPEDQILSKLQVIGISPPKELIQLYEWHNGIVYVNAFFSLMTVDEAITAYSIFRDFKKELPEFGWQASWFPVLTTNGDIQHCIDLETGAVIDIDLECDTVEKLADHYEHFLDAMIYLFDNDLIRFDGDAGCIECKDGEWAQVAEKFSIKAAAW